MSNGQPPASPPTPSPASTVPLPKKPRARRTCLIVAAIGCLVAVLGAAGIGVAGYRALHDAHLADQASAADGTEKAVANMVESFRIPDAEKQGILEPVRDLAARTRKDEVSAYACLGCRTAIERSPVPAMILAMGFESRYVESSGLTQEERDAARATVARYAAGLASSSIPNEYALLGGLADAYFASGSTSRIPADKVKTAHILNVTWPYVREEGRRRFKPAMTDAEIRQCLSLMKEAADTAGIDERALATDLAGAIKELMARIIEMHVQEGDSGTGGGGHGSGRSRRHHSSRHW